MPGDALAQHVERLDRHVPDLARVRQAQLLLDDVLPAGQTVDRLAAVAAAGAAADLARLEHDDVEAALAKVERRAQAGQAASDDRDVAADCTRERRMPLRPTGGRGVVRIPRKLAVGLEEAHRNVR